MNNNTPQEIDFRETDEFASTERNTAAYKGVREDMSTGTQTKMSAKINLRKNFCDYFSPRRR